MSNSTKVSPLFIAIAIIAISIGVFTQISSDKTAAMPELAKAIILPKPKAINDTEFIDHHGKPYSLEQMRGKWSILFFGFTNCPDICPTTMQTLSAVKAKVSEAGWWDNYQVIMVTVDPERDSTERLAKYVPYFDSEFIGLSSDVETTTAFAKQLGILFVKRDIEPSANSEKPSANDIESSADNEKPSANNENNDFYQVDHSASIILINPDGQWAGVITAPHKTNEISQDLIKLAQYSEQVAPLKGQKSMQATTDNVRHKVSEQALSEKHSDEKNNESNTSSPVLTFSDVWVRAAPPNAPSMAAYVNLINDSNKDITLTDVQSDAFAMAMIHDTRVNDGVASMHHIEELTVPANSRVTLQPLGKHMMLMNPKIELNIGDEIVLVLTDSNGQRYSVNAKVQKQAVQ